MQNLKMIHAKLKYVQHNQYFCPLYLYHFDLNTDIFYLKN